MYDDLGEDEDEADGIVYCNRGSCGVYRLSWDYLRIT